VSENQIAQSSVSTNRKIVNMAMAADIAAEARQKGQEVVLAHGVFDLVHLGHVRHLEAAKREGDVLIVSLTEDHHTHKGPGRPVFPAPMRAEMLASLHMVDWVVINDGATSVFLLKALKPSVYIKGSEYAKAEDDVTGKIVDEQEAVESGGGRMVFTDDIVFSSSALINRYLDVESPELREYLETLRQKLSLESITGLIEKVADYKVLLVGDAIIDEYQYVAPMGKSAKENMISTRFLDREVFAGGVFAAANHVASFCAEVEVITCLGRQDSYEDLIRTHLKPNVKLNVVYREGKPTTRKSRFVERNYLRKMFEVYFFEDTPLPDHRQQELDSLIAKRAGEFDLVIVTDFGHGLIAPSTIEALEENSKFLAVNAQSNSANQGYNLVTKYPKASYICIDAPEARLAVSDKFCDMESLIRDKLAPRTQCQRIIVTHGDTGCITYDANEGIHTIPAFTQTIVDTVGAGDAFLSVTSPFVASGAPLDLVGFLGNAAGAMKVGIVGHRRSIEKIPFVKYITRLLK
jgi:rfaE bifunctional protein nucleotidyltransferase chain/domain